MTGLDADWFGIELASGDDNGSESFLFPPFCTAGLESDPGTWFGHIVPGTGTGGFAGWSGSARIRHDDQGAYFEIELA